MFGRGSHWEVMPRFGGSEGRSGAEVHEMVKHADMGPLDNASRAAARPLGDVLHT